MNAHAARTMNAATLCHLADRYDNHDDITRDFALSRMGSKQPAFWYSTSCTHTVVGTLCLYANMMGSIEEAQERCVDEFPNSTKNYRSWEWLDRLVPLNEAAVRDLDAAYTRARTFRERIEIGVPCAETVRLPAARVMAGSVSLLDAVRAAQVV